MPVSHSGNSKLDRQSRLVTPRILLGVVKFRAQVVSVVGSQNGIPTAVIVGLDLLPQFFNSQRRPWVSIGNALPINAWETLVSPSANGGPHPTTVTEPWVVLAVSALVAATVAGLAVYHRDI